MTLLPVASGGADLPGGHEQREVPRHDAGHDADGFARDQTRARRGASARPRRRPCRSPPRTSGCSGRRRECRWSCCRRWACPCRSVSRARRAGRRSRSIRSAKRWSTALRSAGARRDQRPSSKAARAAATARSTSVPRPCVPPTSGPGRWPGLTVSKAWRRWPRRGIRRRRRPGGGNRRPAASAVQSSRVLLPDMRNLRCRGGRRAQKLGGVFALTISQSSSPGLRKRWGRVLSK